MARCIYCREPAGVLRRTCRDCSLLLAKVTELLGNCAFGEFLDGLAATGVKKEKIRTFLYADPTGKGSVYDQMTSEMANDLIRGMGIEGHQSPDDVKRIRGQMAASEK